MAGDHPKPTSSVNTLRHFFPPYLELKLRDCRIIMVEKRTQQLFTSMEAINRLTDRWYGNRKYNCSRDTTLLL